MRRYPPSTIYRYLDLPSTEIIQTHNSQRQAPLHSSRPCSKPPTYSPHTLPKPKRRHTSNTPLVHTGLVKPKPNPLLHSPPTPPRAKHIHISHTPPTPLIPRTTLIPSTSADNTWTTCTTHMPCTHHNHTSSIPTAALPSPSHSLSIHTCNTNNSKRITVAVTIAAST